MLMTQELQSEGAPPRLRSPSRFKAALLDLGNGLLEWPTWWVLAQNDIRQRYRRSALGQFWVTIAMGATIAGMGLIFSVILNQAVDDYIPFLGAGLIIWGLVSSLVNELATAFIASETYLKAYPGPRSAVIYRAIARNVIVSAHNALLLPVLMVLFKIPLTFSALLAIPGLALIVLNAIWVGILIGPLCARFRDLPQLIMNVVQLAFFLTPIMFRPAQIQERLWVLTHLNPFASFVELVRAPLLGGVPDAHHYVLAAACTVVGYAVALPFYARFRGRIVYWL
jgi:ABC-type polysaccharide/polyol phosphate export permease